MPRYAFTLAYYQKQKGNLSEAARVLDELIAKFPDSADAYILLGGICEKQGKWAKAEEVYNKGLAVASIPFPYKLRMKMRLEALKGTFPEAQNK